MTAHTAPQGLDALFGVLAPPVSEESVEAALIAASVILGVRLTAVWEYEGPWGLAGFLAVRVVTPDGRWRVPPQSLTDHLRGAARTHSALVPWAVLTACDAFDATTLTMVDGTNFALICDLAA